MIALAAFNPTNTETRRGTLSVFSELQAVYSSQRTLHELYFHQHDEKQVLEKTICGAMNDLGELLSKVAAAINGSAIQKRQNVAKELRCISDLAEEMLSIAKQSYSASLAASQTGHLTYEHTVTFCQLRTRVS